MPIADLTGLGWLTRKLSGSYVTLNAQGQIDSSLIPASGEDAMAINSSVPASGNTVQIADGTLTQVIKPTALLALLTVKLPPNPTNRQPCEVVFTQGITGLTVTSDAASIAGAAGSISLGGGFMKFRYRSADNTWYRVG